MSRRPEPALYRASDRTVSAGVDWLPGETISYLEPIAAVRDCAKRITVVGWSPEDTPGIVTMAFLYRATRIAAPGTTLGGFLALATDAMQIRCEK